MVAISRSRTTIYIVAADTAPSALASSDIVTGEIKSYSKSGGEDDVESDPVFGGFVDKEKPRSQFEVSFEVIPALGSTAEDWEALIYGEDTGEAGIYTSALNAANKMIVIQGAEGSDYKSWAFNNCNAVTLDYDHNADDNQTATLNFKFSPTTSAGAPNFMYGKVAATALPLWSALDTE